MLKRICPACGRLYEVGSKCDCSQSKRRLKDNRKQYDTFSRDKEAVKFYHDKAWSALSEAVQKRSAYLDTLQSFLALLSRRGAVNAYLTGKSHAFVRIVRELTTVLVSETGLPARLPVGRIKLVVHHIVPRSENRALEYEFDNLIALHPIVHNLIHDHYDAGFDEKAATQELLRDAVREFNS